MEGHALLPPPAPYVVGAAMLSSMEEAMYVWAAKQERSGATLPARILLYDQETGQEDHTLPKVPGLSEEEIETLIGGMVDENEGEVDEVQAHGLLTWAALWRAQHEAQPSESTVVACTLLQMVLDGTLGVKRVDFDDEGIPEPVMCKLKDPDLELWASRIGEPDDGP